MKLVELGVVQLGVVQLGSVQMGVDQSSSPHDFRPKHTNSNETLKQSVNTDHNVSKRPPCLRWRYSLHIFPYHYLWQRWCPPGHWNSHGEAASIVGSLRGLYELDFVVLTQNQISTTLLRLVAQSVMTSGESFWGLSSRRQDLLLLHHSLLFLLNQLDWSRPLSPACEQQIITREH